MIIILLRLYPYTVTKVVISHNNRNSEIINDRMVVWLDLPLDRTDCHRMLKLEEMLAMSLAPLPHTQHSLGPTNPGLPTMGSDSVSYPINPC